ncbi:MAG: hypothetical protein J7M15_03715, partial [Anaerolineae bacterium]|nr:hypothetical protein [Anaerolineae bacterium]
QRIILGPPPKGEGWQTAPPLGAWFAAETQRQVSHALVGYTVTPGLQFPASRATAMLAQWPQHADLIRHLT